MLNYHVISPSTYKTTQAQFHHYLTLGSHKSPQNIHHSLTSLSLINLYPQHKFIINMDKLPEKAITAAIALRGQIRINQLTYNKWDLITYPKYFQEQNKNQTTILYLQAFKQHSEQLTSKTLNLHKQKQFNLNDSIRISIQELTEKQQLKGKGNKMLVFVEIGRIVHHETEEIVEKYGLVLVKCDVEGSTGFMADRETVLVVLELL